MRAALTVAVLLLAAPTWAQTCVTEPSGLPYPSWVRPPDVQMAGEAVAASLQLDPDGEVKAAAIGMSTAGQLFGDWDQAGVVSTFSFHNATLSGAILGHPGIMWETPTAVAWDYHVTQGALKNPSVRDYIQVLFIQTVHYDARWDHDQLLWKQATLDTIDAARQVLPALKMVYLVPMAGTVAQSRMMGEPYNHSQSLRAADIEAEWTDATLWVGALSSLWSDRTEVNPDGHAWACSDWQQDLIHYTASGAMKAGDYFGAKVEADSTTRPWMFGDPPAPPTIYDVEIDGVVFGDLTWLEVIGMLDPDAQQQTISR